MDQRWSCAEARQIDLVAYLGELGFTPAKIRGQEYWYHSPLRVEKTPSFKVDRGKNLWYDHGLGRGGNTVDFGLLFHRCSLGVLLETLDRKPTRPLSFHPRISTEPNNGKTTSKKLALLPVEPLSDPRLIAYILERKIDLKIAGKYLRQVSFQVGEKLYAALGFGNNSGGWELRNRYFKGSTSPKDVTLLKRGSNTGVLAVFEGCFSFLSYLQLRQTEREKMSAEPLPDCLVLNSLSLLEKSRQLADTYPQVSLYLDRDAAGEAATKKVLSWSSKYRDESALYAGHKDLNDYLRAQQGPGLLPRTTHRHRRGPHL